MSKKGQNGNVRFKEGEEEEPNKQDEVVSVKRKKNLIEALVRRINESDSAFKLTIEADPELGKKDSVKDTLNILSTLKQALEEVNKLDFEHKMKHYFLCYNTTIYIYDICKRLRQSEYGQECIPYLAFCIVSLESYLILQEPKYLEWRVKLYVQLAQLYEDQGNVAASLKTVETLKEKILAQKSHKETTGAQSLLDYVAKSYQQNLFTLAALELKYRMALGNQVNTAELLKKKLEELFGTSLGPQRLQALLEGMRGHQKNAQNECGLQIAYDLAKDDIQLIVKGLKQKIEQSEEAADMNQEERQKIINEWVDEDKYEEALQHISIEDHIELLKVSYYLNNKSIFSSLVETASYRCEHRRVEVPFIVDIRFQLSSTSHPIIPNGYTLVNYDLNEPYLKTQLAKLRNNQQQHQQAPVQTQGTYKQHALCTDDELKKIEHEFSFMMVKRSWQRFGAITDVKVVQGEEEDRGGEHQVLKKNGYTVRPIPIKQYTGVQETQKLVSYLCFRQENREDTQQLVDLTILQGKHPQIRPDYGYNKLPLDLRQVPKEFIKNLNNTHLFMCTKIDREFFNQMREMKVLHKMLKLQESLASEKKVETVKQQRQLELDINYDIELLDELQEEIKRSLTGELGQMFYQERIDMLLQIGFIIWKDFLMNQLRQMDHVFEVEKELREYVNIIGQAKNVMRKALETLVSLVNMQKGSGRDVIWVGKMVLELVKLEEEEGDWDNCIAILKQTIQTVEAQREYWLKRGVDSRQNQFIGKHITCDNACIVRLYDQQKMKYLEYKNRIGRMVRQKEKERALNENEQKEEEYEVLEARQVYLDDDNQDKELLKVLEPIRSLYSEGELMRNDLHLDLYANYYRLQNKIGQKTGQRKTEKDLTKTRLSQRIVKKMAYMDQKTSVQTQEASRSLVKTLQEAGKLEQPQPVYTSGEKSMIKEANKNNYLLSLVYLLVAQNKSNPLEQHQMLHKVFTTIQAASAHEQQMLDSAVRDSVYLLSELQDTSLSAKTIYPFDHLYDREYIEETKKCREPILVGRGMDWIALKMPAFNPRDYQDSLQKEIRSTAVFGRKSYKKIHVSQTCNLLANTGVRQAVDQTVVISNLAANEVYCFAVGAYNGHEDLCNDQLGLTSEDILTAHPFSIHQLYGYLAKVSYQLGDYTSAHKASHMHTADFIKASGLNDQYTHSIDHLKFFRLSQSALQLLSLQQIHMLTESLLIMAMTQSILFAQQTNLKLTQVNLQKVLNYLLLAVEVALVAKSYSLAKRILLALYNQVQSTLVQFKPYPLLVNQIFQKAFILICEIPNQYWDKNLSLFYNKISYQIVKLSLQNNEVNLIKMVVFQGAKLQGRTYEAFPLVIYQEEEVQQDAKAKKEDKNKKKQDVQLSQADETKEPNILMKLFREFREFNALQDEYEETLLQFNSENGELVQNQINTWKLEIENLQQYITDQEICEKVKKQLTNKLEFWEILRDPASSFQKYKINYCNPSQPHDYQLEFGGKLVMRLMELVKGQVDPKQIQIAEIETYITFIVQFFEENNQKKKLVEQVLVVKKALSECINSNTFYDLRQLELLEECYEMFQDEQDKIQISCLKGLEAAESQLASMHDQLPEQELQIHNYYCRWSAQLAFLRALSIMQQFTNQNGKLAVTHDHLINILDLSHHKYKQKVLQLEDSGISVIDKYQVEEMKDVQKREESKIKEQLGEVLEQVSRGAVLSVEGQCDYMFGNLLRMAHNVLNAFQVDSINLKLLTDQVAPSLVLLIKSFNTWLNNHKNNHYQQQLFAYDPLKDQIIHQYNQQQEQIKANSQRLEPIYQQQQNKKLEEAKQSQVNFEDIEQNQQQKKNITFAENTIQEEKQKEATDKNNYNRIDKEIKKEQWFLKQTQILELVKRAGDILSFLVQLLTFTNQQRVLVGLIIDFTNCTEHIYGKQLLKFLVKGQQVIFDQCYDKVVNKREELNKKVEEFNLYQQKKRKKKREMMLSQTEKPQEEIEYEKEQTRLLNEISELEKRSQNEKNRLEDIQLVYSLIKRDSNKDWEKLSKLKKEIKEFGKQEQQKNVNKSNNKQQNIQNEYFKRLIMDYNENYRKMESRDDKYGMILVRNDLGDLYTSQFQIEKAKEEYNNGLNCLFHDSAILKRWRNLKDNNENKETPQSISIKHCLLGINLLGKLIKHCYYNNQELNRECLLFAGFLNDQIYTYGLPHPTRLLYQSKYKMSRFQLENSTELVKYLEVIITGLYDISKFEQAMGFCILMEMIGKHYLKSNILIVRSKVLKSMMLAECGQLNESAQQLVCVSEGKGLDVGWVQQQRSQFFETEQGDNYEDKDNKTRYENYQTFYHDHNWKTVNDHLRNLKDIGVSYGMLNQVYQALALQTFLFKVYENEVFEKQEYNDKRLDQLQSVEKELRGLLKKVSGQENLLSTLIVLIEFNKVTQAGEQQDMVDALEKEVLVIARQLGIIGEQQNVTDLLLLLQTEDHLVAVRQHQLLLMTRIRHLLFRVASAQGLNRRAYYIVSQAVTNINGYACDQLKMETGEETNNTGHPLDSQVVVDPKDKGAKAKVAEVKGTKNDKKDLQQVETLLELDKYRQIIKQSTSSKKEQLRMHDSVYYLLKFKSILIFLLYQMNKLKEALKLIAIFKQDCLMMKEENLWVYAEGLKWRIEVKMGEKDLSMDLDMLTSMTKNEETYYGQLLGDMGELQFQKKQYESALKLFSRSVVVFTGLLSRRAVLFKADNQNSLAHDDNLQLYQGFMLQQDQVQEISKKGDKLNIQKKEEKKKEVKKDGKKAESSSVEIKIQKLLEVDGEQGPVDLGKQINMKEKEKNNYSRMESEGFCSMNVAFNNYQQEMVELYMKAVLREMEAQLQLDQQVSPDQLNKLKYLVSQSCNVPISLRVLLGYFEAKSILLHFNEEVEKQQNEHVLKYFRDKDAKYKKLAVKGLVYKETARNKYMADIPNFSHLLQTSLLPLLQKAKDLLRNQCLKAIKEESLFYEWGLKVDDILLTIAQVSLLQAQYRPRVYFKYISNQQLFSIISKHTDSSTDKEAIEQQLQEKVNEDSKQQLNSEYEACKYIQYAIEAYNNRQLLMQQFQQIGSAALVDVKSIPKDIEQNIKENNWIAKSKYDASLKDDKQKMQQVNPMDLLNYIQKIEREAQLFTFSGHFLQRNISKLHRYLKTNLKDNYAKCLLQNVDVTPKQDANKQQIYVDPGQITIKNTLLSNIDQFKFVYILGPIEKSEIIYKGIEQEDFEKVVFNEEKKSVYGQFFIPSQTIDELYNETLNLKISMIQSDQYSESVKQRDYQLHQIAYNKILEKIGNNFFTKENIQQRIKYNFDANKYFKASTENQGQQILDKNNSYIPEAKIGNVECLIDMLSAKGLTSKNMNLLVILRAFHYQKYK